MPNLNEVLFSRMHPAKKLYVVNNVNDADLMDVNIESIARMIKEAGEKQGKRNAWDLSLSEKPGNAWNSTVLRVSIYKKVVYIDIYVQLDSTDTMDVEKLSDFLKRGEYRGAVTMSDYYGNPQTYYYTYDYAEKVAVIRAICREYIKTKYKDKLATAEYATLPL